MPNQLGSLFSIAPSDVKFLRRQVNAANIKIIRYDQNGQPIYGYLDINNIVRELGLLGTFNPLDSSIYVNAPIRVRVSLIRWVLEQSAAFSTILMLVDILGVPLTNPS